jgi:hypothetical protein
MMWKTFKRLISFIERRVACEIMEPVTFDVNEVNFLWKILNMIVILDTVQCLGALDIHHFEPGSVSSIRHKGDKVPAQVTAVRNG